MIRHINVKLALLGCRPVETPGEPAIDDALATLIAQFREKERRVFNHPQAVFTREMLRPELQDLDSFADGVDNIVITQRRVAERLACARQTLAEVESPAYLAKLVCTLGAEPIGSYLSGAAA